jgi:competence protein ComEC
LAAALIGFARLLGGEPSILRAAAMGCVLLLALGMGRRVHPLATLASAGWFWLGQNPLLIRDTGFLLSLGASFGIIYLGPPLFDICVPTLQQTPRPPLSGGILSLLRDGSIGWFRQLLRFTVMCALVTFTAQLGVLPALACTVGRISVSGFFANLFAVPLGQMVLFLGALSGVSGFICPAFSLSINSLLGHLANALIAVAHDFAHLPLANTKLTPLPVWVALSYYATCVLLVERARLFRSPNRPSPPPAASSPVHPAAGTMISLDVPLPPEMH